MSVPESLCLQPWIHAHVTAQGRRALCCMDLGRLKSDAGAGDGIGTYWNGEDMRKVRRDMLAGILPERCSLCRGDGNRAESLKDEVAARWPDYAEIAIASTDADGATSLRPFTFDYRSSICNLKCRTCGPASSTTSEAEARQNPNIAPLEPDIARWDHLYRQHRDEMLSLAQDELLRAARAGDIRQIYWAGGEPLFDETHWKVMSALIAGNHASSVDVAYNTNLTMLAFKGQTVEAIWPHFRSVYVQASVDGIGEVGEYIRTGFNSGVFTRNLDRLVALSRSCSGLTVSLDVTITSLGLLHLGDLLRFALERRLKVSAKLMSPRATNYYMAVEFLPRAVRHDWCRRWMDWILRSDTHGCLGIVYDVLLHCLKTVQEEPQPDIVRRSAATIRAFEKARADAGMFDRLCAVDDRMRKLDETGSSLE